jgi:hypothetical protein
VPCLDYDEYKDTHKNLLPHLVHDMYMNVEIKEDGTLSNEPTFSQRI